MSRDSTMIFVFGSNLSGRHGAGAARTAMLEYGAQYGRGVGRQGNSYAIPTKDGSLQPLKLPKINLYVQQFIDYAKAHPELTFNVTAIGTGLAGYAHGDIAPMFSSSPPNCKLPKEWTRLLRKPSKSGIDYARLKSSQSALR